MARSTSAPHAGHDEQLIARLYGGDLEPAERSVALALIAECPECAAIYSDLGALARATAGMPVPPRPRDFSLTPRDAARLRPRRVFGAGLFGRPAWRVLGGALTALGLTGVVVTGGLSVFGGAASTAPNSSLVQARVGGGAPEAVPGASLADDFAVTSSAAAATAAPAPSAAATAAPAPAASLAAIPEPSAPVAGSGSQAGTGTTGQTPAGPEPPGASASGATKELAGPTGALGLGIGGTTPYPVTEPSAPPPPGSLDARLIWLGGFGLLFGVGLLILILPVALRGRRSSSRS